MFKVYLRYSIIIVVLLIVYFLICKLIGLHKYPVFSAANGLIFAAGMWFAMKKYKSQKHSFKYEKGFQIGLFTGGIATIFFAGFMALYIFEIDTQFAGEILDSWDIAYNKGSLILIVMILLMGFATSVVLSLAFMQLLKDSWNTPEGKRNTLRKE